MKHLLMLIGCSGSGKSTFSKNLYNVGFVNNPLILSTDEFFIKEGKYIFVMENLGKAHQWNFSRFLRAINDNHPFIVIDNTNLTMGEISKYVIPATVRGYTVEYKFLGDGLTVDDLEKRNIHGVPRKTLEAMMERYKSIKKEFESWNI